MQMPESQLFYNVSGSQNVFSGPAASTSPKNVLQMQILRFEPRPTESETGCGVQESVFQ